MALPFVYDALPEPSVFIRQLTLLPAISHDAPICCEIKSITLAKAEAPKYEALSYCWGDPGSQKHTIFLNDCTFLITSNLNAALLQLRHTSVARTLWVDAICINQAEDAAAIRERSAQVSIMQQIYASCERVLVWLGEADGMTPLVFDAISRSVSEYGRLPGYIKRSDGNAQWQSRSRTQSSLLRGSGSTLRGSRISDRLRNDPGLALRRFIDTRPWFNRIWIVQEIAVSPKAMVICGNCSIEWEKIEVLNKVTALRLPHLERLIAIREVYQNEVACVSETEKVQWWQIDHLDLARLVTINRTCGARDARDHIYALWAMVDRLMGDAGTFGIKPDYLLQESELFKYFTTSYLRSTKRLDLILARSSVPSLMKSEWPSWVWQASYSNKYDPAYYDIFAWPQPGSDTTWHFDATLDSLNENFAVSPCGKYLRCSGYVIARIEQVGLPRPDPRTNQVASAVRRSLWETIKEFLAALQCFVNWYHLGLGTSGNGIYSKTGEACRDVLWQLCCARVEYSEYFEIMHYYDAFEIGLDPFLRLPVRFRQSHLVFTLLLFWQIPYLLAMTLFGSQKTNIFKVHEFVKVSGLSCNRTLFRADTGEHRLLGLGLANILEGDVILLLQGARVPVVLRAHESVRNHEPQQGGSSEERYVTNLDTYTLVGECLTHGIMYGEMYDPKKCHDIWLR